MNEPTDQPEQSDRINLKAAYLALIEGYVNQQRRDGKQDKGGQPNANHPRAI